MCVLHDMVRSVTTFCACIQVVLAQAAEFLQANASSLNLTKSSPKYAFKWLQLADGACLTDACKACADLIIDTDRTSCTAETLAGLSPQTLMHMVQKATSSKALGTSRGMCSRCCCLRNLKTSCTYCDYSPGNRALLKSCWDCSLDKHVWLLSVADQSAVQC
jgi:hypothetical protein